MQSLPLWISAAASVSPPRLVNVTDSCRQQVMQSMPQWISAAASASPPRVSHQPRGRQCQRFLQTAGHAVYVTVDFHSITCLTSPCLASTSWKTMPDSCRQQVMQSMSLWISTASPVSPPRVSHQPRGRQCQIPADSRSCSLCHCGFPQHHLSHLPVSRINLVEDNATDSSVQTAGHAVYATVDFRSSIS